MPSTLKHRHMNIGTYNAIMRICVRVTSLHTWELAHPLTLPHSILHWYISAWMLGPDASLFQFRITLIGGARQILSISQEGEIPSLSFVNNSHNIFIVKKHFVHYPILDLIIMDKLLLFLLILSVATSLTTCFTTNSAIGDDNVLEKGYRSLYRVYEECQQRNVGVAPCLKKKAIAFFDRIGKIESMPIAENLELVRSPDAPETTEAPNVDLETLGRTSGASRDEVLNDILFEKVANLMNGFNVQIRLPKTSSSELKRSIEEGRGKMKKMMGMMMMGMAMKMAAMVPLAMGVLFLLAGKALIISKIALVLSMIIGLKKLLSQKGGGGGDHGGWQQGGGGGGGGWDRSLKGIVNPLDMELSDSDRLYAQNLAYSGARQMPQTK